MLRLDPRWFQTKAPVVASWNAGNGRVLCYLREADGKFSGDFARWTQAGEFFATLARWTAGKHQPLPEEMLLTQEIRDGVCFVQLHLDPARKSELFSALPRVRVLHGVPGAAPARSAVPLQWKNADLLEAAIGIAGAETVLNTVEISGQQPVTMPPVCLPYSPEFAPDQPGRGAATLSQIATTTGGKERIEIPKLWGDLPIKSRYLALAPWLLVSAAILFLLEILDRRTGWVARLLGRKATAAEIPSAVVEENEPLPRRTSILAGLLRRPARGASPRAPAGKAPPAPAPPATSAEAPASKTTPGSESTLGALRKAQERAHRRTGKDR